MRRRREEITDDQDVPERLSFNDIMSAMAAMKPATGPQGYEKVVIPIVVAVVITLLGWVGFTLSAVNTSVATIQVSLAVIQKTTDQLSANSKETDKQIADLQTRVGQHDLRLNSIDTLDTRMNERIRIVEGQKPLDRGALQ